MKPNGFPASPLGPPRGGIPCVGIATFAGYPFWDPQAAADLVVLGIPYDEGTTNKPGTRFGPRGVREASMLYSYEDMSGRYFDSDRRRCVLRDKKIADGGDVEVAPLCLEENWRKIGQALERVLQAGALPAVIGGDHSVTHPVMRAFGGRGINYLHLDTHVDCDRIFTSGYTHGSPVALIHEEKLARTITLMGIRGLTNSGHDVVWIQEEGAKVVTARELRCLNVDQLTAMLPEGEFYISLDIDFFDPAVAPATGTPEPGGLFFPDFCRIIEAVTRRGRIVGFDVVEVSPFLDGGGCITSQLAARCLLELAAAALG